MASQPVGQSGERQDNNPVSIKYIKKVVLTNITSRFPSLRQGKSLGLIDIYYLVPTSY
jgi:hypothetical protein